MTKSQTGSQPDDKALSTRLRSVIDYVRDCERRVNRGEVLELQGLDQNVLEICDGITALPAPQGKKLEADMAALIADLDRLAVAMKAQQAKTQAEGG